MPKFNTRAAIVSIGDELVLGQNLDTNSRWLSDRLMSIGIPTVEHVTIGDDQAQNVGAFQRLASMADLIISTGGLGPTLDDLTRQALAEVLGDKLVLDEPSLEAIRARFAARGRTMTEIQKTQAYRPSSARMIPNAWGTAPGLTATIPTANGTGADVCCLPGPPGEMKPMFETLVLPALKLDPSRTVRTRFIHLIGIGEGDAAARLGALMDRSRIPLVGITASGGVLTCRVRYEGPLAPAEADRQVDDTARLIRECLAEFIFGEGDDTLASATLGLLRSRKQTLSVVESCTGGELGGAITAIAGASAVFVGGFLTYSNELKQRLVGVPADLIHQHGAVSEQVAAAMAVGGLARAASDHCLAVTGVAGPDGGTPAKPVGTVFIAHAQRQADGTPRTSVRVFSVPGSREDIRKRSVMGALAMLRLALTHPAPQTQPLLWESKKT